MNLIEYGDSKEAEKATLSSIELWPFRHLKFSPSNNMNYDGLLWLKMLQIAESFILLTFSTIVYDFHQSFE